MPCLSSIASAPALSPRPAAAAAAGSRSGHLRHRRHHDTSSPSPPSANNSDRPLDRRRVHSTDVPPNFITTSFSRATSSSHRHGWPSTSPVKARPVSSLPQQRQHLCVQHRAPAAPRIAVCDSTTNFQSSSVHSRSRPPSQPSLRASCPASAVHLPRHTPPACSNGRRCCPSSSRNSPCRQNLLPA